VGHLGYFHSLVIMNNAAINMGVHVPLLSLSYIPLGMFLGVKLLDHMVGVCLIFWGASNLLSTVVELIYILTNSVGMFLSLTSLLTFVVCVLVDSHFNGSVLICISFMVRDVEHFYMCILATWISLKKLFSVHLFMSLLSHWVFGSLVFGAPYAFWLLIPCQV
jgi:hypothetical protein